MFFADGEDENTLKAAIAFKNNGLGIPVLIAKKEIVKKKLSIFSLYLQIYLELQIQKNKMKRL